MVPGSPVGWSICPSEGIQIFTAAMSCMCVHGPFLWHVKYNNQLSKSERRAYLHIICSEDPPLEDTVEKETTHMTFG